MYPAPILPTRATRPTVATVRRSNGMAPTDAERVMAHLATRRVLRLESRAAGHVRSILHAPPEALRVDHVARRRYVSRRTLARHFHMEGLPCPVDWIVLAKAMHAHRAIARGAKLRIAAAAAGYSDQFAMSNGIRRTTGLRPSQLRDVHWDALLDVWIARKRECGALTRLSMPSQTTCRLCGRSVAAAAA